MFYIKIATQYSCLTLYCASKSLDTEMNMLHKF